MQKTTQTNLIHAFVQEVKRTTGTLCCVLVLFCVISCSSHNTTAHYHGSHMYTHTMDSEYGHQRYGHSLEFLAIEVILLTAIVIVPPVLEAVGEFIDGILVEIGLKKYEPSL